MSFSSSAHPSSQPTPRQRQQWEVDVLTARLPAQIASLIAAALLAPGPTAAYTPRPWEPMARFSEQAVQRAALERVRALLHDELRQARCLVWTPLANCCRLKRNAPLAIHAERLAQLAWELERRPGVRAVEEARRAVESLAHTGGEPQRGLVAAGRLKVRPWARIRRGGAPHRPRGLHSPDVAQEPM